MFQTGFRPLISFKHCKILSKTISLKNYFIYLFQHALYTICSSNCYVKVGGIVSLDKDGNKEINNTWTGLVSIPIHLNDSFSLVQDPLESTLFECFDLC